MTNEQILTCAIDIGQQLLINGAEISRVEDTIDRICRAYGVKQSHIFSIASCIIVSLENPEGVWVTQTRRISNYGTNMYGLDRLNNLSRKICATKPEWEEIRTEFDAILKGPQYSWMQLCASSCLAAAAFTVFFGGDLRDGFAAVFVAVILKMTQYGLGLINMKPVFSNIICSIISGLACILVCAVGLGRNVDAIMIGNIMLLIPGVLLTNSFRDFISGDMITGLLHFSEALIIAMAIAGGFIISMLITGGIV